MARHEVRRPAQRLSPARAEDRFPALPFVWWAIGLALLGGLAQGTFLFLALAVGAPLGSWWLAMVQSHGHLQLFGWAGMFALGIGLHFLPRLRGSPAPDPRAVRWSAWLLGGGLVLRAISQPLAAAGESSALVGAFLAVLVLSGLLELAGGGLALGALAAVNRRGPPLRSREPLLAVLPYLGVFASALLLGLAFNSIGLALAVAAGTALVPASLEWSLVHLGLIGMLVPISAAVSARTFPLYLRLRVPEPDQLRAVFTVLLIGFLFRALWFDAVVGLEAQLAALGTFLEGIGLLGLAAVLDVPLRRGRRQPLGQEGPPRSEDRAAAWLIVAAYAWLALAGLILVAEAFGAWWLTPRPPIDAERHALGVGFVTLLILGMAVRLVPGFVGRPLYSAGLVWATLWLGLAAAVLRVGPLFLPMADLRSSLLAASGLLSIAAVACLGWNLWQTAYGGGQRPAGGNSL